jgi:hypothetical protein
MTSLYALAIEVETRCLMRVALLFGLTGLARRNGDHAAAGSSSESPRNAVAAFYELRNNLRLTNTVP